MRAKGGWLRFIIMIMIMTIILVNTTTTSKVIVKVREDRGV